MGVKLRAGQPVIDAVKLAYRADTPVLLEGGHGVGKSQLLKQAATELGIDILVRDLSLMEPPDLVGLPVQRDGRTVYAPPGFLPADGRGLLVFEEVNRSERYMLSPCLQLLSARTLNDYNLPPGWLPVAAINPSDDGYDVNQLDAALLSRFVCLEVEPSVKEWTAWATNHGVHEAVVRYVTQTDEVFASSNPRAWTYVSNVLKCHESGDSGRNVLLAVIAGLVGGVQARAFLTTYLAGDDDIPLTLPDIAAVYPRHRPTVKRWVEGKRTDLLAATAHAVKVGTQSSDLCARIVEADGEQAQNIADFLSDLPADLATSVKKALKKAGLTFP